MDTKHEVRSALRAEFESLVVGPKVIDETISSNPADTYLTGILWPRGTSMSSEDDDGGTTERASTEETSVDSGIPGYRAIRPCSIGLSCLIELGAEVEIDLASTARYMPVPREAASAVAGDEGRTTDGTPASSSETPATGDGPRQRTAYDWKRTHLGYRLKIGPKERRTAWRSNEFVGPDGSIVKDAHISVDIKRRVLGKNIALTVTLINESPVSDESRDKDFLFQAGLRVHAIREDRTGALLPRPVVQAGDDEDTLSNLLLYRDVQEFAVGHGVAARWQQPVSGRVEQVETSWLPDATVKSMSAAGHPSLARFSERGRNPFSAAWLSQESDRSEVCAALNEFCNVYMTWIGSELQSRLGTFAEGGEERRAAEVNLKRCTETLARLRQGVEILEREHVAWTAFAFANAAMERQSQYPSKPKPGSLVWRPFQLAFILLVIPSLIDPKDGNRDTMDLLWFPTGGGKTEAYLALTAFAIFASRLKSDERRGYGGVDVLMRYTLRLLTIQQFQRAATLIAACEAIRVQHQDRFGQARISIGLYVGGDSTPNKLEDALEKLTEEQQNGKPKSTPRQLLRCPVCGSGLTPNRYHIDLQKQEMGIRCAGSHPDCQGISLPVMTVDEAIYAHPPSLLIGTVDKIAQLPRRKDIRALFGLDTGERPSLIIQDELHLISGPLGSMAGLYEVAIDMLCSRNGVRPKVIGSTATIGRAASQVRALFDRAVLQFPPPGYDAADSFFAVRDSGIDDRLYLGVASIGRSPKFALQAVLAALLQSAYYLRNAQQAADAIVDPYWTCVAYFNSLRELGGAHVMMLDDVPRQMRFLAHRQKGTPRPLEGPAAELSSRKASNEIPEILMQLERGLVGGSAFEQVPSYAVLASNMISVGVDVPRLGLMVVNGQPKATAEYIQATSRVGRGLPGLVVTIYNFGRPRDVSHFEHFQNYHSALYRSVEPTSVTPWAARARDKALHAVLAAVVRHLVNGMVDDESALQFDPETPDVTAIIARIVERAKSGSHKHESLSTRSDLAEIVKVWGRRSQQARATGERLLYWEKRAPFGRTAPHLMRAAEELHAANSVAWPTPNSLRDVEPSTAFVLKAIRASIGNDDGDA